MSTHNSQKWINNIKRFSKNTNTMKENTDSKSIFDKLYEDVMKNDIINEPGEDTLHTDVVPGGHMKAEYDDHDEPVDINTQIADIIEKLQALQASISSGDDEGQETIDDIENIEDAEAAAGGLKEGNTDLKKVPDSVSKLAGSNNKAGNLKPTGGKASTGDSVHLKHVSDSIKGMTSRSNKVGNITPGKSLFQT